MRKILFFPLLRMPSGHHQVADALAAILTSRDENMVCKKVDLLSEWSSPVEHFVTKAYLEWIHLFPKSYARVYKKMAYQSKGVRSYRYYDFLFKKKMKEILEAEKPDLIICTHAFPSYLMSQLKTKGHCNEVPVINVYTDFFINDVWGKAGIDYHFVPSQSVKNTLVRQNAIPEDRIIVTGIPTDERFTIKQERIEEPRSKRRRILVSGGSVGLGNITEMLVNTKDSQTEYEVLCGQNHKLYQEIEKMQRANVKPLAYISSREEMNELYNHVDAIITKAGGVTISEALKKRLPIFVHSALPGQEEINLKWLVEQNLVQMLNEHESLDEQLANFFENRSLINQLHSSQQLYLEEISAGHPDEIASFINQLLDSKTYKKLAL